MIHSASLINDPFGDPGVYVDFKYRREAFLFDLGDFHRLPSRKLLKIDYIFVSHTHMDHFIGFDHLLRISLGRDRRIHLYGPPHFLQNVEDKLRSYTWNLVANYTNDFELLVTEIHPQYKSADSTVAGMPSSRRMRNGRIVTGLWFREISFPSGRCSSITVRPVWPFVSKKRPASTSRRMSFGRWGFPRGPGCWSSRRIS